MLHVWEKNIQDHHENYLATMNSISAMGSRAQLELVDAVFDVIGRGDSGASAT